MSYTALLIHTKSILLSGPHDDSGVCTCIIDGKYAGSGEADEALHQAVVAFVRDKPEVLRNLTELEIVAWVTYLYALDGSPTELYYNLRETDKGDHCAEFDTGEHRLLSYDLDSQVAVIGLLMKALERLGA